MAVGAPEPVPFIPPTFRPIAAVAPDAEIRPQVRVRVAATPERRPRGVPVNLTPTIVAPGTLRRTAIPGRSAQDIARRLDSMTPQERIDAFAGMPVEQRTEVANVYYRGRASGRAALTQLHSQFSTQGLGNILDPTAYARKTILADILDPHNRDGEVSDATGVHLDLRGIPILREFGVGSYTGANAATILERSSTAQIERIKADMQRRWNETLATSINNVGDARDRAYLQFLANPANREQDTGMLRPGARNAWLFRNASAGFGLGEEIQRTFNNVLSFDPNPTGADSFGTLLQLNRSEAEAMRLAHSKVTGGWRIPEPGANVGNDLRAVRLQLAGQGLQLDPRDANNAAARQATSDRMSSYVAATIMHARETFNRATPAEVDQALAMVRPDLQEGDAREGRPTINEVVRAYRERTLRAQNQEVTPWAALPETERTRWRDHITATLNEVAPAEMRRDVVDIMAGRGADSPNARARAVSRAIRGNVAGPYLADLYRGLDLRNIPEARRERYATEMQEAFKTLNGNRTLEAELRRTANAEVTLPNNQRIPSRAMALLAARGRLTDTQRVMYALHDRGPWRNGEPNLDEVSQIANELSPMDRLVMRDQYRRTTGEDILAHLGRVRDPRARIAENSMLVSPHEATDIMRQMALMTAPLTAANFPGVNLAAAQAARDNYWRTVMPDEAQRREFLARFQGPNAAQAITNFATQGVDSSERWTDSLERLRRSAAGNAFTTAMNDVMSDSRVVSDAQMAELVNRLRTAGRNGWTAEDIRRIDPARLHTLIGLVRARARLQTADVDKLSDQTVAALTLIALGAGTVTSIMTSAGAATPLVMAGFTAAARVAGRAATDRLNGHVGRELVLGALPGLFTGAGMAGYFGTSFLGVVAAGGFTVAGTNAPVRYMEQDWRDPARALERMARRSGTDFVWGAATTAALYGFVKLLTPADSVQNQGPTRLPSRDRPVNQRPERPGHPTGPRPGVEHPDPPVVIPGKRPSGPVHTQTGPAVLPDDRVSGHVMPTGSGPARVPTGSPARDLNPGRTQPIVPARNQPVHDDVGAVTGNHPGTTVIPTGGRTGTH